MTAHDLATKGRALYGERWQTALSEDLGVADRTVRRWLAGDSPIPETVESQLRTVMVKRLSEMGGLIGFTINPAQRLVVHYPTNAFFRYDEAGDVTLLNEEMVALVADPEQISMIKLGAAEAVHQELTRDPRNGFGWLDRAGRPSA